MGVPATSGILRTNILDMQIGDYIVCNYQAASGVVGTFSNFGGIAGTEIPVASSATPNGTFYFIKADKGLLIADRVAQHSISWDALNAGKLIQGLPFAVNPSAIPVMTSNTTPTGIASASSIYDATATTYKAFDGDISSKWSTAQGQLTGWLAYDFGSVTTLNGYSIYPRGDALNVNPKDWTFEGWDGTNWVVLDKRVGVSFSANVEKYFLLPFTASYQKFRINITTNNGNPNFVQLQELRMYTNGIGVLRSPTGGVGYADANGNLQLPFNASLSAFPKNNEWDTYILNSNLNGTVLKGNDNVWHWNLIGSWCQDTPVNGLIRSDGAVATNAFRVARGYYSNNYVLTNVSTTNISSYGHRPVFEYKETW
jgi:hypothetical protein